MPWSSFFVQFQQFSMGLRSVVLHRKVFGPRHGAVCVCHAVPVLTSQHRKVSFVSAPPCQKHLPFRIFSINPDAISGAASWIYIPGIRDRENSRDATGCAVILIFTSLNFQAGYCISLNSQGRLFCFRHISFNIQWTLIYLSCFLSCLIHIYFVLLLFEQSSLIYMLFSFLSLFTVTKPFFFF